MFGAAYGEPRLGGLPPADAVRTDDGGVVNDLIATCAAVGNIDVHVRDPDTKSSARS